MPVYAKPISALEKCFMDETFESKAAITGGSALKGEEFSFQIAYASDNPGHAPKCTLRAVVDSPLADYITIRTVEQVPVRFPCYADADDNYLRKTPGLYPILLQPINSRREIYFTYNQLKSLFVTVKIPEDAEAGDFPIKVSFASHEGVHASAEITLHIVDAVLPKQTMTVTQWFHCDCIANYYNLETFSDRHFEYIGKFMKCAVDNGINAILMPVFTPPLDTHPGGERRTTQLVGVRETENGWEFDFSLVERWVALAKSVGVEYYEVAHLYTQWGAGHAPKVMGYDKNGEFRRLFGWETDSLSDEYREFLRAFLTAFIAKMKELGVDKQCLFHISDEPGLHHLERYTKVREQIADILEGYVCMDALSSFEFYQTGAVPNPIPSSNHVMPFIEAKVPNLWTYYCCVEGVKLSNRFFAMPSARTRIIGTQFWKYNIAGFLQWGFNFYNAQGSTHAIDPYLISDGDYFTPAGDCFSVYPGPDGVAYETLPLKAFTMGLADTRAFRYAEQLTSREEVAKILDPDGTLTFKEYPTSAEWLLDAREKINALIEKNI